MVHLCWNCKWRTAGCQEPRSPGWYIYAGIANKGPLDAGEPSGPGWYIYAGSMPGKHAGSGFRKAREACWAEIHMDRLKVQVDCLKVQPRMSAGKHAWKGFQGAEEASWGEIRMDLSKVRGMEWIPGSKRKLLGGKSDWPYWSPQGCMAGGAGIEMG